MFTRESARKSWVRWVDRVWLDRPDARTIMLFITEAFPSATDAAPRGRKIWVSRPYHAGWSGTELLAKALDDITEFAPTTASWTTVHNRETGFTALVMAVVTDPGTREGDHVA